MNLTSDTPCLCPFCNGEPHLEKQLRDGYKQDSDDPDAWAYWLQCNTCAACGGWAKNQHGALHQWNTRAISEPPKTEAIRLCIQAQYEKEDYSEARKELNALLARLSALEIAHQHLLTDRAFASSLSASCPKCGTFMGVDFGK